MQILLLMLFNVFMGAVLYLIISLKLERSATEFRERKLRKEMDEIIREFNATAERNITLLENRIMVMKGLLGKGGDKKMLNVVIDDESSVDKSLVLPHQPELNQESDISGDLVSGTTVRDGETHRRGKRSVKKSLPLIIDRLIHKKVNNKANIEKNVDSEEEVRSGNSEYAGIITETKSGPGERKTLLVKDLSGSVSAAGGDANRTTLSEEEIAEIVSLGKDKYSLVSVLHNKGCSIEDISQYSGIPIGEVRLVLNLVSSR